VGAGVFVPLLFFAFDLPQKNMGVMD